MEGVFIHRTFPKRLLYTGPCDRHWEMETSKTGPCSEGAHDPDEGAGHEGHQGSCGGRNRGGNFPGGLCRPPDKGNPQEESSRTRGGLSRVREPT